MKIKHTRADGSVTEIEGNQYKAREILTLIAESESREAVRFIELAAVLVANMTPAERKIARELFAPAIGPASIIARPIFTEGVTP